MLKVLIASMNDVSSIQAKEDELKGEFWNNTYLKDEDRLLSSIGKIMVRRMLAELGLDDQLLNSITYSDFGKPILPYSNIDFNISHSGDITVAVVSTQKNVGIDIERRRKIDLKEYQNTCLPNEWEMINKSDDPTQLFYEFWTKKESLLKAHGLGLQIDLQEINVRNEIGQIGETSLIGHFKKIDISGYSCFLCTDFECDEMDVSWLKL